MFENLENVLGGHPKGIKGSKVISKSPNYASYVVELNDGPYCELNET